MSSSIALQAFIDHCPPSGPLVKADDALLRRYRGLLPDTLLELWSVHGFGLYAGGLLQLVNPDDYKAALYEWLMYDEEDPSRLPIAVSAFGKLFYYRRLTETDEDISCIDPEDREGSALVCAWSLDEFFREWLTDPAFASSALDQALFEEAVALHGPLAPGQVFCFTPSLRLGGRRDARHVAKGDAAVHLHLLYEIATGG